jgi:hypothetical protein
VVACHEVCKLIWDHTNFVSCNEFYEEDALFQVLYNTALCINETEQWPFYTKISIGIIKVQSRGDV